MRSLLPRLKWKHIKALSLGFIALMPFLLWFGSYWRAAEREATRQEAAQRLTELRERMEHPPLAGPNRYEKFDREISIYLAALQDGQVATAMESLAKAKLLAAHIANRGDRFALDALNYYSVPNIAVVAQLREARKLRLELETASGVQSLADSIKKAEQVKGLFDNLGAVCDSEQIDVLLVKFLNKLDNMRAAQTAFNNAIPRVIEQKHLFIYAQLLRWQGEVLSNQSQFAEAITVWERCINIASNLDVPAFLIYPQLLLGTTYHVINHNQEAFEQCFAALKLARETGTTIPIQLVQVLGVSAFNIQVSAVAEEYLSFAIALSIQQNNQPYLAMSYTLAAIIQAEQQKFDTAEDRFKQAINTLAVISDQQARARVEFAVIGYYARAKMLAGDAEKSIELYERALVLARQTNVEQMLALSQLHQGLGEALIARGNRDRARDELKIAIALDQEARHRLEQANPLLTYAVSKKHSQEILLTLD